MKKMIPSLIFVFLILFLLAACLSCGGGGSDAAGPSIHTISWQTDADGFLQYSTNDPSLYDTNHRRTNNTIQTTMSSVETRMKRISGNDNNGYGIIYCYQDSGGYYAVIISDNGSYIIIKVVAGTTSYYIGGVWTTTEPSFWPYSSSHYEYRYRRNE